MIFAPKVLMPMKPNPRPAKRRARVSKMRLQLRNGDIVRLIRENTIHTCSCGRAFTRMAWMMLPYVGIYDDGVERLELRNCHCHSTRAIVLKPEE
jgi:hypothetical protein